MNKKRYVTVPAIIKELTKNIILNLLLLANVNEGLFVIFMKAYLKMKSVRQIKPVNKIKSSNKIMMRAIVQSKGVSAFQIAHNVLIDASYPIFHFAQISHLITHNQQLTTA